MTGARAGAGGREKPSWSVGLRGGRLLLEDVLDVAVLPLAAVDDLAVAAAGERVRVRAVVDRALLDQALFDELVEVRVQPPVVDLRGVALLERVLDGQPFERIIPTRFSA